MQKIKIMPKYGKIARLPRSIRDELNRRLDDGEMGVRLVEWLNSLPEVKKLIETDFAGREITEQNLTKWKTYGYLDWQAQQEALTLTRELNTNATELADSGELTESLARVVAARYASALYGWNGELTDEIRPRLRALRGLSREVVRLRRSDQFRERMKIDREWLDWERQKTREAFAFNQRRHEDRKREQEEMALQICIAEAKDFPEVQQLFRQSFQALKDAQDVK